MSLSIYLNFETEAKEAIAYYESIFNVTCNDMMHYKDMPKDPENYQISKEAENLVANASLKIHDVVVMFSDVSGMGMEHIVGNNFTLVVDIKDESLLVKEFNSLAKDGTVVMPLAKTFWSEKFGYLVDKFGIGWQFNLS